MTPLSASARTVLEAVARQNTVYSSFQDANAPPRALTRDDVPDRTEKDMWGNARPGRTLWNRLEKAGLILFPEEEPITLDNGTPFVFTSYAELTDKGERALRDGFYDPTPDKDLAPCPPNPTSFWPADRARSPSQPHTNPSACPRWSRSWIAQHAPTAGRRRSTSTRVQGSHTCCCPPLSTTTPYKTSLHFQRIPFMATWHGFMMFMAESPIIGIDPQPAYTPEAPAVLPTDGAVWATQVYHAEVGAAGLRHMAIDDAYAHAEMRAECRDDDDDEDEPDVVMQVAVDDDGTLHVFDQGSLEPFRTFTARQVFEAYGVPFPETTA